MCATLPELPSGCVVIYVVRREGRGGGEGKEENNNKPCSFKSPGKGVYSACSEVNCTWFTRFDCTEWVVKRKRLILICPRFSGKQKDLVCMLWALQHWFNCTPILVEQCSSSSITSFVLVPSYRLWIYMHLYLSCFAQVERDNTEKQKTNCNRMCLGVGWWLLLLFEDFPQCTLQLTMRWPYG